jgi:hypothetical protein
LFFYYRDHLLQGFEISTLVFFGTTIEGIHNNRVFSHCISNLILVINEDVAKSLQLDENLSLLVPIYGLLTKTEYLIKVEATYCDHSLWYCWVNKIKNYQFSIDFLAFLQLPMYKCIFGNVIIHLL